MKLISNTEFGGERPLFESHDLRLENVTVRAGESPLKSAATSKPSIAGSKGIILSGTSTASPSTDASSMSAPVPPCGIPTA